MLESIQIRGARQHNLQHVDAAIPRNSLTVVTGVSGSGKSSLTFDTIYAEGQRRYVETLSPYVRQFLEQLERPDVDSIDGLSPALSIEQKSASRSRRSTVGTVTEIYDYLRLLFAAVGTPHCVDCDLPIEKQPSENIAAQVSAAKDGSQVMVLAPYVRGRKGHYRRELEGFARQGFVLARIDGTLERLDDYPPTIKLDRNKTHTIEVVVDRLVVRKGAEKRLRESIQTASGLADGLVVIVEEDGTETLYSEKLACIRCGRSVPDLEPRSFSFNSRYGACEDCDGLGMEWDVDMDKLVLRPERPLLDGALPESIFRPEFLRQVEAFAKKAKINFSKPWRDLDPADREWLAQGFQGERSRDRRRTTFHGLLGEARNQMGYWQGTQPSERYVPYMSQMSCHACGGTRLRPESLAVRVGGHSIAELAREPVARLAALLSGLELGGRKGEVAGRILHEIGQRLDFLLRVGVGYLALDRPSPTLSGGEAQRVRLATQIGTRLRGVLYVLDEPSIGLHSRDHGRLLDALVGLRDLGNTIVVVEHDQATIERADHVLDLGPAAGRLGGHLVAFGSPAEIAKADGSLTADYLAGRKDAHVAPAKPPSRQEALVVRGARQHNLKSIDVEFPLGNFCVVTGVSGSGKSTLVNGILHPALSKATCRPGTYVVPAGDHDRIDGLGHVDKVVRIDQTPVGRTPRSNPATYTGAFTPIREFFSMLPESRARGYGPGRFSFNVRGGRCDGCDGDGMKRIEMNFLPDVFVHCDVCQGRRYNQETRQVLYKGQSIADLLETPVEDVLVLMENLPAVRKKLQTLVDVGLGYIHLGQSSTTISGGEAQRMKLARELSKRQTGRTVYILDEPTTGLHFDDIKKLLLVLRRLVDHGNTVIVIEHQLDVVRSADWIVDLGPEGGEDGGEVVCAGTPADVASSRASHTGQALRGIGVQ